MDFMRRLWLSLLFAASQIQAAAQQLTFRGKDVDTVRVFSFAGKYHFDDDGTTTTTSDECVFSYDTLRNTYQLSSYVRTKSSYSYQSKKEKEQIINMKRNNDVSLAKLKELLFRFEEGDIEPTSSNIGWNSKKFQRWVDNCHIRQVLRPYRIRRYPLRGELFRNFASIVRREDTFSKFLDACFQSGLGGLPWITDVWDEIWVECISGADRVKFKAAIPRTFKQPWYELSDTTNLPYYHTVLNFSIHQALVDLLPPGFYRMDRIRLSHLAYQYIMWCYEQDRLEM